MGVVLKRALYFITCSGKMMYPVRIDEDYITRNLLNTRERIPEEVERMTFRQLSLFDDMGIGGGIQDETDLYMYGYNNRSVFGAP